MNEVLAAENNHTEWYYNYLFWFTAQTADLSEWGSDCGGFHRSKLAYHEPEIL